MPRFRYVAFAADGKQESGTIEAATEGQAWDKLNALGLTVVDLSPETEEKLRRATWIGLDISRSVPVGAQADVAEQLAVLFASHLRTSEIASLIARSSNNPDVRRSFEKIGRLMEDGASFAQAFDQSSQRFSPVFRAMARLGQASSDPAFVMRSLGTFLRRQHRLQSQFTGALIYPAVLLAVGFGVILLMSLFLAPALAPMFTSLEKEPPAAISFFLSIGELLGRFGILFAVGAVMLCLALMAVLRERPQTSHRAIAAVPLLGAVLRVAAAARLTRALNLLLKGGLPLSDALRQSAACLPTELLASTFVAAAEEVEAGGRAGSVFSQESRLPVVFRDMFAIGEDSNNLVVMTEAIATLLEELAERQILRMTQLVTPLITIVLGGGLALMVFAIMDAILSVNDLAF